MDLKFCLGDDSVAVQVREYGFDRGDIADRENGMVADPFKGTVPDVRGFPSIDTFTDNSASGEEGMIRGWAPAISWSRTRASTMIRLEELSARSSGRKGIRAVLHLRAN